MNYKIIAIDRKPESIALRTINLIKRDPRIQESLANLIMFGGGCLLVLNGDSLNMNRTSKEAIVTAFTTYGLIKILDNQEIKHHMHIKGITDSPMLYGIGSGIIYALLRSLAYSITNI